MNISSNFLKCVSSNRKRQTPENLPDLAGPSTTIKMNWRRQI